eukprot:TRINITY_DN30998_c0_g2_i1.p1 TRINITY_DN30998_c0_g2~~TRINITY_DN30998_c0_g2_i1.p1  ORF type:complete len:612 (-),score=137.74 TRINITY_DN30998_c0_g2_i1:81-1886(-)
MPVGFADGYADIEELGHQRGCTRKFSRALSRVGSLPSSLGSSPKSDVERFDTPEFVQGAHRSRQFVNPVTTSVFELLKIGIGPSSSHTVGPMVACRNFTKRLVREGLLANVERVNVELRGSLALTGIGHGTNKACVLGLHGVKPAEIDPSSVEPFLNRTKETGTLELRFGAQHKEIPFVEEEDVILVAEELPLHPNGMICQALGKDGNCVLEIRYYSVGGGFILNEEEMKASSSGDSDAAVPPIPFSSMADLQRICEAKGMDIAAVVRKNEEARRSPQEVEIGLEEIWSVMEDCVDRGLDSNLIDQSLPGPLGMRRRAPALYKHAQDEKAGKVSGALLPSMPMMDELRWLDCYALAVMEENASMGRVVTAPTNGAAGVVPAVLTYYMRHLRDKLPEGARKGPSDYLLTAAVVGIFAKEHACISGAAGGCQAEVGTATAMAAAGLCAVLGGTPAQVEEAAEIALEHSLGMTCDPILGLVQAPCIERNSMGATKALNAVSLVLKSPPSKQRGMLTYDGILRVMKETGESMDRRYRETALGGLAADYEKSLESNPELQTAVQECMGFSRIQHGTRRRLKREVTYKDLTDKLVEDRKATQAQSKC